MRIEMEQTPSEKIIQSNNKNIIISTIILIFFSLIFQMCSAKNINRNNADNDFLLSKRIDSLTNNIVEKQTNIENRLAKLELITLNLIEIQSNSKQKQQLLEVIEKQNRELKKQKEIKK